MKNKNAFNAFKRKFEEEMRFVEMRLKMKKKYGRKDENTSVRESVKIRLLKLVLSLRVQSWIDSISGTSSRETLIAGDKSYDKICTSKGIFNSRYPEINR